MGKHAVGDSLAAFYVWI